MKNRILHILPVIVCLASGAAHANWQYPGTYVGDGWYADDGSRFTISVRGGASYSFASIKNDVGTMSARYYYDAANGWVVPETSCAISGGCDTENYQYAGIGDLADLPAADDYSDYSFAAGASIGWTIPNRPQWRLEAGWDHIAETHYNASPLFSGQMELTGGDISGIAVDVQSGSVHSDINTDIISIMAFYDFFDGVQKPTHKMIPYIGLGLGYADTKTTLNLSDSYGDLSESIELRQFGDVTEYVGADGSTVSVVEFYPSETTNSNVAGILAMGFSYGLSETMFLDFGARLTYVPKIKWALSNEDDTRHRDWFSAENLIYANIMLGLRFEF
ncbi:MAG: hypothetical protein NC311_01460 [Muribaculaceae bacterium]|nr:hypothetical protein [Muribaculaceae bacterium]